jgi:cell division protein ZapA
MSDGGSVIPVEIHGQRYPIRSSLDPEYVARLALYVDQKMRAAAETAPNGDLVRLAVLAALNIADECFRARDEGSAQRTTLSARAVALEEILDLALRGADEVPLARIAGSQ